MFNSFLQWLWNRQLFLPQSRQGVKFCHGHGTKKNSVQHGNWQFFVQNCKGLGMPRWSWHTISELGLHRTKICCDAIGYKKLAVKRKRNIFSRDTMCVKTSRGSLSSLIWRIVHCSLGHHHHTSSHTPMPCDCGASVSFPSPAAGRRRCDITMRAGETREFTVGETHLLSFDVLVSFSSSHFPSAIWVASHSGLGRGSRNWSTAKKLSNQTGYKKKTHQNTKIHVFTTFEPLLATFSKKNVGALGDDQEEMSYPPPKNKTQVLLKTSRGSHLLEVFF